MQNKTRKLIVAIALFLGIGFVSVLLVEPAHHVAASGLALPALPARFYGSITLTGANAPASALLTATLDRHIYATVAITLNQGSASYVIDVPSDDPTTSQIDGAREGDEVRFSIRGYRTAQHAVWHEGQATALDLTFTPTGSPPTPSGQQPVNIPEPATVLLLSAGLAALTAVNAKRRRQ